MIVKVKQIAPGALKHPDAARYLGISPAQLDRLRDQGEIEGFLHNLCEMHSRRRLHWSYRKSELDRYLWDRQEKTRSTLKTTVNHKPGRLT